MGVKIYKYFHVTRGYIMHRYILYLNNNHLIRVAIHTIHLYHLYLHYIKSIVHNTKYNISIIIILVLVIDLFRFI